MSVGGLVRGAPALAFCRPGQRSRVINGRRSKAAEFGSRRSGRARLCDVCADCTTLGERKAAERNEAESEERDLGARGPCVGGTVGGRRWRGGGGNRRGGAVVVRVVRRPALRSDGR